MAELESAGAATGASSLVCLCRGRTFKEFQGQKSQGIDTFFELEFEANCLNPMVHFGSGHICKVLFILLSGFAFLHAACESYAKEERRLMLKLA